MVEPKRVTKRWIWEKTEAPEWKVRIKEHVDNGILEKEIKILENNLSRREQCLTLSKVNLKKQNIFHSIKISSPTLKLKIIIKGINIWIAPTYVLYYQSQGNRVLYEIFSEKRMWCRNTMPGQGAITIWRYSPALFRKFVFQKAYL